MTRNRVLNVCIWSAFLAYVILVVAKKLADFEVPFRAEWKLALMVFVALCFMLKRPEKDE